MQIRGNEFRRNLGARGEGYIAGSDNFSAVYNVIFTFECHTPIWQSALLSDRTAFTVAAMQGATGRQNRFNFRQQVKDPKESSFRRGKMKLTRSMSAVLLATSLVAGQAQTSTAAKPHKKPARHTRKPAGPTTEQQIQGLRDEMNTQIQGLKTELQQRDAQLQQAQQAAAAAQASADQATASASAANQAASANNGTVTQLQSSVADLKTNSATIVQTIQDDQVSIKKAVETPEALHYKGITLSPAGSFLAAETVFRTRATGGDIPTAFNAIPLENSPQSKVTEFFGSGRQSRITMLAEGKTPKYTMRGYYEADFVGNSVTSNNNQTNSYALRQRQLWAQAELASGLSITGGQMWSLAAESKKGTSSIGADIATPQTIDVNYLPGFVYVRQYGFRVSQNFHNKFWLAASVENPQILNVGGIVSPNFLIGEPGVGGGLFNSCASTTNGTTVSAACANYSFNVAPDILAKVVAEPGYGHFELFGIARFFRDRVYPGATATPPTSAGAFNDVKLGGGIGGSARIPTFHKKLDLGLKGLYGDGVDRYGATQLADITAKPNGRIAPLHGFSALATVEVHATPRLDVYMNYGGDSAFRSPFTTGAGAPAGYGNRNVILPATCSVEPLPGGSFAPGTLPGVCGQSAKTVQEGTIGYWYDFYKGPKGRFRQGLQYAYINRSIWSGIGFAPKGNDNMFFTSLRYFLP